MPREIIQRGAAANDGTGDNLRVTADKINRMFGELYGVFQFESDGDLRIINSNGTITIGAGTNASSNPAITIPENNTSPILIGTPTNPIAIGNPNSPGINIPAPGTVNPILRISPPSGGNVVIGDPSNPNAPGINIPAPGINNPITIGNPGGGINIGNPGSPGISIPAPGSNGGVNIGNPTGPISVGNPNGPGISIPAPGSNGPINLGNPTGPINLGNPGSPGISIPAPGSNDPIKIGDPSNPGITVPTNPQEPVRIGKPGQPVDITTGLNKWELLYTGDNGKLDSSQFLKVTPDGDDEEGKSLHLHTARYSSGINSKLQSAIYFVDDVQDPNRGGYANEITESKRAASLRFVKQSFGQGLIATPYSNFNDTAFHDKGGIAVWRAPINGIPNTKVTLNDDAVGPSIHGLYLGRGAISFFQDLAGGSEPDTGGLAYIVMPGIPDGSGINKVGQIFANPYRNRTEDGNSGIPYFGLGWKNSTQLVESGGGTNAIEDSERTPGNEVITWHTTNRVGIMNNDPNFTLSVTGDVAFTKTLRVGDLENPGTTGQVLTSTGSTTAPVWQTPADQRLSIVDDDTGNTTYNLMMTTATSGPISTATVDGSDVTYNPSTGTLSTPNLLVSNSGVDFTGAVNALYFNSTANRVTLANYNTGGNLVFEVNGGAHTATFGADGTYKFDNLYNRAVGAAARPLAVGSDGIIGYGDPTGDSLYDKGTGSGNLVFDRNQGTIQKIILTGNVTGITIQNMGVAQSFTIIFTQDGVAGRTLSTSSAFKYASGFKTLSTASGAIDMLNIFYDGSTYYCTLTTGYA